MIVGQISKNLLCGLKSMPVCFSFDSRIMPLPFVHHSSKYVTPILGEFYMCKAAVGAACHNLLNEHFSLKIIFVLILFILIHCVTSSELHCLYCVSFSFLKCVRLQQLKQTFEEMLKLERHVCCLSFWEDGHDGASRQWCSHPGNQSTSQFIAGPVESTSLLQRASSLSSTKLIT